MKLFIKYIKEFSAILICISQKKVTHTVKENNIEILFNNEEIIGFNIFNIEFNETKMRLEDLKLKEIVKPVLKKYFKNFTFEDQFIVVKIEQFEKIPNTHLSLCKVNNGKELIQIVCGASNVKVGMYTTLATVGSWMPNGLQIKQGKLKGFDSFGMLCSSKELGLEDLNFNTEGIMELKVDDLKIGASLWKII